MTNHSPIKDLISKSKKVALFGHRGIDGDALGSTLAFGTVLTKLGLKVDYYTPTAPSKKFDFLPDTHKFSTEFTYSPSYDLIICMDTANPLQLLEKFWKGHEDYFTSKTVLNIDHHVSNTLYGTHNFVDNSASSACEYLTEILLELYPDEISGKVATYLFLGLSTDTGHFVYEKDSARTFHIALQLIELGARKKFLIDHFYRKTSLSGVKFMGMLSDRITQDGGVIYTYYTGDELEASNLDKEEADGILGIITRIDHDGVFMLIKGHPNPSDEVPHLKCSFRTKNPALHVNEIASELYNGGGHLAAAGCKVVLDGMGFPDKMGEMIGEVNERI